MSRWRVRRRRDERDLYWRGGGLVRVCTGGGAKRRRDVVGASLGSMATGGRDRWHGMRFLHWVYAPSDSRRWRLVVCLPMARPLFSPFRHQRWVTSFAFFASFIASSLGSSTLYSASPHKVPGQLCFGFGCYLVISTVAEVSVGTCPNQKTKISLVNVPIRVRLKIPAVCKQRASRGCSVSQWCGSSDHSTPAVIRLHQSSLSSLINNEVPITSLTTRHQAMSTKLAVKAQLGLVGISIRCQSCRGTARGGFLVLRQISRWSHTTTTFRPVHNIAPSRPNSVFAGPWRIGRAGRTTFSTSSLRRVPDGENPPAAAGEAQAGGKAGEN